MYSMITEKQREKALDRITKIMNKYNFEIVDINCDNPQKNKCFSYVNGKQQTLEGVPTIVLRKNNNDIEYKKDLKNNFKGDRSVDELVRFTEINK